jgi:hypothetical protein
MARPAPPKPDMPNTGRVRSYDPPAPPTRVERHRHRVRPAILGLAVAAGIAIEVLRGNL